MEQVKPIILRFEDGIEYTLEFNRESVKYAEEHGFIRDDISEKIMTRLPELFHYAFRMHHPTLTMERTSEILFNDLGGLSEEAVKRLVELYIAPYNYLINNTGKTKNSKLKVMM